MTIAEFLFCYEARLPYEAGLRKLAMYYPL